jgi:lipoyl(octanoyl) transferase
MCSRPPALQLKIAMISVIQLGKLDYAAGLRLQQKLVEARKAGQIGDVLLLLEHTPVITLGRNAKAANVLASAELLATRGVEVFECDRGGDVTFHGPGQLVGYPIFDLRGFGVSHQPSAVSRQEKHLETAAGSLPSWRKTLGAVDYVRRLEDVLIRTCADFGISAKRVAGLTGVWTAQEASVGSVHVGDSRTQGPLRQAQGRLSTPSEALRAPDSARDDSGENNADIRRSEAKIAAIGVHISRSVTSHGFALNVNTDLSLFDLIVPCGIASKPVTSIRRELGRDVDATAVAESVARNFGLVFERQVVWVETVDALLGNAVGVPVKAPAELRELHGENDSLLA